MSGIADALRHLLLSFELDIYVTRTGLYRPYELPFSYLHGLYLTALRRQLRILQYRLISRDLADTACRDKRNIRSEKLIYLLCAQVASVQTDLRHLATLQSLIYLLQRLVLYSRTNHNPVIFRPSACILPRLSGQRSRPGLWP